MTVHARKDPIEVARLRVRPQFVYVRGGRTEKRKALLVQARARPGETPGPHAGAGFTATKKIGGAVERNRAKRRLREAVRLLLPQLARPGWDYVFIARQDTADIAWARLLDDMESALISLASD
ncbi:MAG: ribonuclease P protein component [Hyphomonas sp.]|uniref:ribonuclease P protein component n=1 Tax=Hyphomonas sp. TaxID=87 RepID=UPI0035291661